MDNRDRAKTRVKIMRESRNGPLRKKKMKAQSDKAKNKEIDTLRDFCPVAAEQMEAGNVEEAQRLMKKYIEFRGRMAKESSNIDFDFDPDELVYPAPPEASSIAS